MVGIWSGLMVELNPLVNIICGVTGYGLGILLIKVFFGALLLYFLKKRQIMKNLKLVNWVFLLVSISNLIGMTIAWTIL
jgi:hypothetical protein